MKNYRKYLRFKCIDDRSGYKSEEKNRIGIEFKNEFDADFIIANG